MPKGAARKAQCYEHSWMNYTTVEFVEADGRFEENLNILLVGRNFFHGGGSTSRLGQLMNFLSKNHKVFVLTARSSQVEGYRGERNNRIQILHCPIKRSFTIVPFLSIINVFFVSFYMHSLLRKLKVDVLLVSIPEFEEGVACALVAKPRGARLVIDIRDLIVEDHVAAVYSVFPKVFRKAIELMLGRILLAAINSYDSAVTVTSSLKTSLLSKGVKIPINIITNGADTNLFRPAKVESKTKIRNELGLDGRFLILYAGAMGVDYYPMEIIFKAFEIVTKFFPDAELILCGSWNKRIDQLSANLRSRMKYLGFLKLEDMARVMQACDIGLITMDDRPSTFVALTTKFFEYLASGMPVVASVPVGGELDRLINAEQVGYTVAPLDYRSMAERIIRLLRNDDERQMLAKKGIELVTTKFDRVKLAENFQDILLKSKIRER